MSSVRHTFFSIISQEQEKQVLRPPAPQTLRAECSRPPSSSEPAQRPAGYTAQWSPPAPRLDYRGLSQQWALEGSPPSTRNSLLWLLSPHTQEWLSSRQAELSWMWLFSGNIWCEWLLCCFFFSSLQVTTWKDRPASLPRTGELLHYFTLCFRHCTNCFHIALAWREGTQATTWEIFLLIKSFQQLCLPEKTLPYYLVQLLLIKTSSPFPTIAEVLCISIFLLQELWIHSHNCPLTYCLFFIGE